MPADNMTEVLQRLVVPASDPDAVAFRVRSIFRRHVQSSITPPLTVRTRAGAVEVDLDVRVYDNYRVREAVEAVRAVMPGARLEAVGS